MTDDLSAPYIAAGPDTGLTLLSRRFWDAESQAEQRAGALRAAASSAGMETIQGRFVDCRHAARRGGDSLHIAAEVAKETARAYAAFHRGTPTPDEIDAAREDHREAVEAVRQAALADRHTAALCEIRDVARRHLDDLVHRREAAIAELERCLTRVLERLHTTRPGGKRDINNGSGRTIPGTPLPTPPPRPMPMPGPPAVPGTPPLRSAPPSSPPPATSIFSTPGTTSTDSLAQLLSQAAKPQPVQPAMQMPAQQMPQMPQVAPAPQPAAAAPTSRDRKRADALDLDDLLDDADTDAAPSLAAAAVTAPRPAPAGSIALAAPAVPPVSGTSADGMVTSSPTSGRPGQPAAGAFSQPVTSLSGSTATQQHLAGSTPGTAPGTHLGAGAPMAGPMGMPGAGAGGGSGSGRPPVLKHDDGSQLDHGASAQGAAVRGGTIAQRRDEDQPRG